MNLSGYRENAGLLALHLELWGCPMDDSTQWKQNDSGEYFTSPVGTGTAAFWLPCVSMNGPGSLPGTCESCVIHAGIKNKTGPSLTDLGVDS